MNRRRSGTAPPIASSGSIFAKEFTIRSGSGGMAAALPEVLCAGKKLALAGIGAHFLGCGSG